MLSPPELPVIPSPETSRDQGWRHAVARPSLPEIYRSLPIPESAGFLRKLVAFAGPGYLVAVGYMDPGNWATDLAGGSKYKLLAALGHHDVQPDGHPVADPGH
jgi:manganese transport protein